MSQPKRCSLAYQQCFSLGHCSPKVCPHELHRMRNIHCTADKYSTSAIYPITIYVITQVMTPLDKTYMLGMHDKLDMDTMAVIISSG